MTYYPYLDGLRGIAILLVIAYHFVEIAFVLTKEIQWDVHVLRMGWVGVDLFFVISGFLITEILLKAKGSKNYYFTFYKRRSLRIFPLYYIFLIAFFTLPAILNLSMPESWNLLKSRQGFFWFYLSDLYALYYLSWPGLGISHLWSLAIEEKFYLFWPAIISNLSTKKIKSLCALFFLLALFFRIGFILWNVNGQLLNYTFPLCRMDSILVGCWLATHRFEGKTLSKVFLKNTVYVSLAIYLVIYYIEGNFSPMSKTMQLLGFSTNALLSMVIVHIATSGQLSGNTILNSRFLKDTGKVCYSLYLFHLPVLGVVRLLTVKYLVLSSEALLLIQCVLWISLCYAMSFLSWKFFEFPILKLKNS